MSGNRCNFGVLGSTLSHYIQNIDTSNTVDGKPIYYWVGEHDKQIPDDAGYVGVVNSTNITVRDLTLTKNGQGVLFAYTNNSMIENVTASDNCKYGIHLHYSSNNNIAGNTASDNSLYGIYLNYSNNNTLSDNTASEHGSGIYLSSSSNNTLTNNTANSNSGVGIRLEYSSNNTLTNNTANSNCNYYISPSFGCGIMLFHSSYNELTDNTANSNCMEGIFLRFSGNNTLSNNTASNNGYDYDYGFGIRMSSSSDNMLTNNTASNNTDYDFYSYEDAYNNTVKNLAIASYPTTISFTYDNGVGLKGVTKPPEPDPAEKMNISKYVNATEVTANSWMFLNVSYNDADIAGVEESTLRLWKNNGSWHEVEGSGVNEAENYVYANITEFSIFAPLGSTPSAGLNCTCGDICVNKTGWWRDGDVFQISLEPLWAAVNSSAAGETICVKDGTYNENVDVTKQLTIRSQNGSSNCIVNGSFTVSANTGTNPVTVTGINCTQVNFTYSVVNPVPIIVSNCVVQTVEVDHLPPHNYTIENSTVELYVTFNYGAGGDAGFHILKNCTIKGSICFVHAYVSGAVTNSIEDCTIGGEIDFAHGSGFINNTVNDCQVAGDISLRIGNNATNMITNNTVQGDIVDRSGACWTTIAGNILPHGNISDRSGGSGPVESEFIEKNQLLNGVIVSKAGSVTIRNNVINCSKKFNGILTESGGPTNIIGNSVTIPYFAPSAYPDEDVCAIRTIAGPGVVTNNTLSGGTYGIHDGSGALLVFNNSITNTHIGVYTQGRAEYKDNIITNCVGDGMILAGVVLGPITGNTVTNNGGSGIVLQQENDCIITGNTASNNTGWDFYSDESSHNNTVENLTIASYPTTVSFIYDNGVGLKGVETAPGDPAGKVNIGKYVNATNVTADSWLLMNVSYSDTDISGVQESTLRLWKHNGSWNEVGGSGVNEAENYVYANITEFSIFAPLGNALAAGTPNITSYAPDTPVNDTICTWRTFNVTVNQTVNVTWYLNDTPLHTNESVTDAYCTLHAEVVGEHNVSAIADNANGKDVQVWVWNVARLCGDVASYPNGNGKVNMGDVTRLLNNVSHPGNPVYVCNAWASDCRCNGIRNMGDVTLLLNNVSHPTNPRYVLDCC